MKKMFGVVFALAVIATACGSSGGSKSSDTKPAKPADSSSSTSTTGGSTDPTSTTLQLQTTTLGKVVADSKGMTVYLYVPDGAGTVSKVSASTLAAWPAVQATQTPTVGPGLTAKPGTAAQPNGEQWVTYNGHLLYTFAGDKKPGDVSGNALGDVWYALTPAGQPVQS